MTVEEIVKQVRLCIDEESNNTSSLADAIDEKDDLYMDNIIKAKIPDALHWISITAASSSVLSGSSAAYSNTGSSIPSTTRLLDVEVFDKEREIGKVVMPSDISVFNINRVRCEGWFKAVIPVEDTDDSALNMFDDMARGTIDRPQAAIMRQEPLAMLIQPMPESGTFATVTYVGVPTDVSTDSDGSKSVEISEKFKSAFLYYLAFLLLSAYEDTKANMMYTIAVQQLGGQTSQK